VKLTRGTGTRDQDKIVAKAKGKTMEDAREDMEILREYIHDLAEDARQINPRKKTGNGGAVFVASVVAEAITSEQSDIQSADASELSPEQRLEPRIRDSSAQVS